MINVSVKSLGKITSLALLVFSLFGDYLYSVVGVPIAASRYMIYHVSFLLFLLIVAYQLLYTKETVLVRIAHWQLPIIAFMIYVLSSSFLRTDIVSLQYYFRAFNIGYAMFCGSIFFFDINIITKKIYKYVFVLLTLHTLLSLYQSLFVARADNVGGIFGVIFGASNTCSHTFIELVTILFFCGYLYQEVKGIWFYMALIMCSVVAAVAEIKIYYFALVIYFIIYMILSKQHIRIILMLFALIFVGYIGLKVFIYYYPGFADFFSVEGVQAYLDAGYGGKTFAVTRTNGYSFIYENLFNKNVLKVIFGNGFAANQADLVNEYNVNFFMYSRLFYYGGIVGSVLYYILPVKAFLGLFKKDRNIVETISALTGLLMILFSFYSSEVGALETSAFYYFMLSLRFHKEWQGELND